MNILVGKIGRPIFFDPSSWGMYAGDEEGPLLYDLLARRHPEHTFYLIGRSDMDKVMPAGNIINLLNGCPTHLWSNRLIKRDSAAHFWLEEQVKARGLRFDVGIFYLGPSSTNSLAGLGLRCLDGTPAALMQMHQNYGGPIIHLLNRTGTPYFLLCGDPRYMPWRARDVYNDETVILSQVNTRMTTKRIWSYDEPLSFRRYEMTYVYAGIETVFMLDEKKVDFRRYDKDIRFALWLNGKGSFSRDRERILEDWVLRDHPDVKVYGVWNEDFCARYPSRIEERGLRQMRAEAFRTRYTLVPPFTKARSSFVTQKFWKMIYYGIIPFLHPAYDTDRIFQVPDILRPTSPAAMWQAMDRIDADDDLRASLLEYIYGLLEDKYFNGDHLHDVISATVGRCTGRDLDGRACEPVQKIMPAPPDGLPAEPPVIAATGAAAARTITPAQDEHLKKFWRDVYARGIGNFEVRCYLRKHPGAVDDPRLLTNEQREDLYHKLISAKQKGELV